MCNIGYHNCSACGEEYKCDQSDSECLRFTNAADDVCAKCEWWIDEEQKDERKEKDRYERMMQEREEWEREHGGYEK